MSKHSSVGHDATSFVNADLGPNGISSLRVERSHIKSVGESPSAGDRVLDLCGDRLLPGLINAHDHLQLNGFERLKYRDGYANVRQWIEDISARRGADAHLMSCQAVPLRTRQVHGGLKNILSGVTTVAHHDPMSAALLDSAFPTCVVANIGWSHSLGIDGDLPVQRSYQQTPAEWPWAIHGAEGVDSEAAREFDRLDELGCIGPNTLIVHGSGMDAAQQERLAAAGAGLIWCPSSNVHLFGTTLDVTGLAALHRVALGTDSRMSGERDLLAELSAASRLCKLDDRALESMVTCDAARLLRLTDRGTLVPGARADILILPARCPLYQATRSDIRLVMLNGHIRLGDSQYLSAWAPSSRCVETELDGHVKLMDRALAIQLLQLGVYEPGLEIRGVSWRAA